MFFADNIIKEKIKNVYFLWGRGKTTIANELHCKYGYFIYDVDKSRYWHWKNSADPIYQPAMCRDYEKEYDVKSFWDLPPEVISERETLWLKEFSPMAIMDLILLSPNHDVIICEGDIDCSLSIVSNAVYLVNRGTKFDWFSRPDHDNISDITNKRTDLTKEEKESIINNAYNAVGQNEGDLPDWIVQQNIKYIIWNDNTTIEQTASEVAEYFNFPLYTK
ncbi:MAG: hypothetical protein FWF15_10470 [Oscillospiraceae bacterium]|nr:hypothetical protein [Oscillospiraceae bacterium]